MKKETNGYDVLNNLIIFTTMFLMVFSLCVMSIVRDYSQMDEVTINIETNEEMTEVFKSMESITYTQHEIVKEFNNINNDTEDIYGTKINCTVQQQYWDMELDEFVKTDQYQYSEDCYAVK